MAAIYDDNGDYVGDDGLDERDEEAEGGIDSSNYFDGVYTDPTTGEKINYNELFNPLGGNTNFGKGLNLAKGLLSGKSEYGGIGQALGIAGLSALFNKITGGGLGQSGQGVYKGYQGSIPKYTASRQQYAVPTTGVPSTYKPSDTEIRNYALRPGINDAMVARGMNQFGVSPERMAGIMQLPVDQVQSRYQAAMGPNYAARRPGSGGVTYFSPMQYNKVVPPTNTTTPTDTSGVITTPVTPGDTIVAPPAPVTTVSENDKKVFASGGIANLGDYSDGGRLLRGPGDGVSDSIPATIAGKQPARLADGEFVIPARIVSEIGNGSTEAGAKKLYAMMDRVQNARKKSLKNVAANTKADKYLPR